MRRATGDLPGAARNLEEALGLYRDLGDRLGPAGALNCLGGVRRLTGDLPGAARAQEEALGIIRDIGNRVSALTTLAGLPKIMSTRFR